MDTNMDNVNAAVMSSRIQPDGGSSLLEMQDVCFERGGKAILEHISLSLARGEIMTLIGPNGSGKTTLVKIALGLLEPDSGTVARKRGLRIGYMPQRVVIDPVLPLTVRRFLSLGGKCQLGRRRTALEEVGAPHVIDSAVQSISGGEFQRVLLARAILREPDLLVLDEPVQGVDVTGQAALYDLISRIRTRYGCAVLMVSHDLHLVMAQTDRVVCLNQHICCSGHPAVVSKDPAFIEMFGKEDADRLAVYHHHHDHVHEPSGEIATHPPGPHSHDHHD